MALGGFNFDIEYPAADPMVKHRITVPAVISMLFKSWFRKGSPGANSEAKLPSHRVKSHAGLTIARLGWKANHVPHAMGTIIRIMASRSDSSTPTFARFSSTPLMPCSQPWYEQT